MPGLRLREKNILRLKFLRLSCKKWKKRLRVILVQMWHKLWLLFQLTLMMHNAKLPKMQVKLLALKFYGSSMSQPQRL